MSYRWFTAPAVNFNVTHTDRPHFDRPHDDFLLDFHCSHVSLLSAVSTTGLFFYEDEKQRGHEHAPLVAIYHCSVAFVMDCIANC